MDAFEHFDISKITGGLKTLRPIKREGSRVTYDSFLFVGKSAIVEVKRLVIEYPLGQEYTIKQRIIDNGSVVFSWVAPIPNVVEVEFGKVMPVVWPEEPTR